MRFIDFLKSLFKKTANKSVETGKQVQVHIVSNDKSVKFDNKLDLSVSKFPINDKWKVGEKVLYMEYPDGIGERFGIGVITGIDEMYDSYRITYNKENGVDSCIYASQVMASMMNDGYLYDKHSGEEESNLMKLWLMSCMSKDIVSFYLKSSVRDIKDAMNKHIQSLKISESFRRLKENKDTESLIDYIVVRDEFPHSDEEMDDEERKCCIQRREDRISQLNGIIEECEKYISEQGEQGNCES